MLVFGLATIPVLFALGFFFGAFMQKIHFRQIAMRIAGVLVLLYSIYIGYKGYILIFHPEQTKVKMMNMKKELKEQFMQKGMR